MKFTLYQCREYDLAGAPGAGKERVMAKKKTAKSAPALLWMFRGASDYFFILAKKRPRLVWKKSTYPSDYREWSYAAQSKWICSSVWHRSVPPALRLEPWGGPVRVTMELVP